ncbi:transglycosylase SLT domain-containing protein [Caenispirillum salinarum]|uniref:lytic transglycosylase domain-containing protein n=1 Tax=Caenispirillum salinarum TaxID=859058 RepID=UPI00384AF301
MTCEDLPRPRRRRRLTAGALALSLLVPALSAPAAGETAMVPAPHPPAAAADHPAGAEARQAPTVLGEEDVALYRRIFALQDAGEMNKADALIGQVGDDILMGHVLFQRYMHPTAWRSRFAELQAWMAGYADHPGADRIHALARQRGDGPVERPRLSTPLTGAGGAEHHAWLPRDDYRHLGARDRKIAIGLWRAFRKWIGRGATLNAKLVVTDDDAIRLLTKLDHDRMRAALGYAYFIDGMDDHAMKWATMAVEGSGDRAPEGLWTAGLATWRQGDLATSAKWFERLAGSESASPWLRAAGAYWAARAYLRTRQPEKVSGLLATAAEAHHTFYGLLARRALGLPLPFRWRDELLDPEEFARLDAEPAGRRAMALVQVGRRDLAEAELRHLYPGADPDLAHAIEALADVAALPSLAMRLGFVRSKRFPETLTGPRLDVAARYPLGPWKPMDGWVVDRALVHAFIRQESGFNPGARSWAGARGLMQLMPTTAQLMRRHAGIPAEAGSIHDPAVNLALGQAYIDRLMEEPEVGNNLFFVAVSYNAGPGNLMKWKARERHMDDPLLFIEAIPSRQTRVFVERVLSNFWIYRHRLGQPLRSLDAVVAGDWPLYTAADRQDPQTAEAKHVQDHR